MFLPLKDDNPLQIIPYQYVTVGLIALCVVVFVWQLSLESGDADRLIAGLAFVPASLFGDGEAGIRPLPPEATLATSIFLHGGLFHLLGNMLYLWVFGDNIEDSMGHGRFVAFFLACGVGGGLAHGLADPASTVPTLGASGAISGILGAYLLLHPKVRVLVLVFKWFPIRLPAYIVLGGWVVVQVASALAGSSTGGVAWWAHIGGFVIGVLLIGPLRRKEVALLDRRPRPWGR